MNKTKRPIWQMLVSAAVLALSCAPLSVIGLPTQAPGAVDTMVAQTAAAAASRTASVAATATATSTFTPTPSRTPTVTPTFTPTYIFLFKTSTPSRTLTPSGGGYSTDPYHCEFISQTPANGSSMKPRADFDWDWKVRNNGTKRWDVGSVDYLYVSGDKFYKQDSYDLPRDVGTGGTVELTVDMVAPKNPGTYTTTWGLMTGKTIFCRVSFQIVVSK
jgi:hypothetical protein